MLLPSTMAALLLLCAAPALAQEPLLEPVLEPPEQAAPEAAEADERKKVSVNLTDNFKIRYWISPERLPEFPDRAVFNYFETLNRFNLTVGRGPWQALVQLDAVMLTANHYILDGVKYQERPLVSSDIAWPFEGDFYANPEKVAFRYQAGETALKFGDHYGAFATGLSLNLNRNVDIDIDTSLQGFGMLYRAGPWDLSVEVGQANRQQVSMDNPNIGIYGDRRHLIAGVRLARYGLGPMDLGVHSTMFNFVDETGWVAGFENVSTAPDVVIAGASADLYSVLGIDWNLEADYFAFPTDVAFGGQETSPGYALYGSAAWYLGPTTWQLEGKRYLNAERPNAPVASELYEVVVGPTLEYERAITEDSAATVNSNDAYGGRLRMDWTAVPGETIPYVSLAVFRDLDIEGLHFNTVPETVFHPMIGTEVFAEHVTLLLNTGWRVDRRDGGGGDLDQQIHGDIDIKVPVPGDMHVDLAVNAEYYQWGDNDLQQSDYVEIETALSLMRGSELAVTWFTDFTDNPLVNTKGNLTDALYGALEVQWKPTPATTIKGFYGAYKAGIRCSGGQCRQLPGFEGARVTFAGSF